MHKLYTQAYGQASERSNDKTMRKERRYSKFSTLSESNPKLSMKQFYNIRMINPWRGKLTARMLITNKCYNTRHNEQENQF